MSLGFVMLCHTALDRAAQVARHWAERGCPVVIHVDARVREAEYAGLRRALGDLSNVQFSPRLKCEWGTWSLVEATKKAALLLLRSYPQVGHVYLASGSCLPLRPVEELRDYLAARPRVDFIESVTTQDVAWTMGGLNEERFQFRFPFSWKRSRRLFDGYVDLQRRLGFKRKLPKALVPHLGSQWWCLSRQTLSAILTDPARDIYDRYFRMVWIPDESYFQTLARLYSTTIESRSLTLSKFDFQGKPHVFYDDHLHLLKRSDCFVARKIWPDAELLYKTFLDPDHVGMAMAEPAPGKIDRLFARALERRTRGRAGLYMASRFPNSALDHGRSAGPYTVLQGFDDLFPDFTDWLSRRVDAQVHGHLFAPKEAEFAGEASIIAGGLSSNAALRDYNPEAFLTSLIWNQRGERQIFAFSPRDAQPITRFICSDPHAQVFMVTGSWALRLYASNLDFDTIRAEAAQLQKLECDFIDRLRDLHNRAEFRIWTMAEFLEDPMEHLTAMMARLPALASVSHLDAVPRLAEMEGFGKFLQNLKNQGMRLHVVGDFPISGPVFNDTSPARPTRPFVVR